jgi:DNA invertase Pin-like site-specific DNA recombinase
MKAAIYCRVSSERQLERHTIGSQRRILPGLAASKGYAIHREYIDDGVSGEALRHMPALRSLLDDAEAGHFSAVLVIDIDRITRFQRESERALIIDICTEKHIKIITPEHEYDLADRSDRLQFGIKGSVSLYEKETIRDRCRRGIAEKKARGQWMGGTPPIPYVYDRNARALKIDPGKREHIDKILSMALFRSPREIARHVDGFSPRMVRRILERDRLLFYSAVVELSNGRRVPGQWPAILTDAHREKLILSKGARNARGQKPTTAAHLLTGLGLVRCGYCGRSMKAWHDRKLRKSGKLYDRAYYRCTSIHDTGGPCSGSKMMPMEAVESRILLNASRTLGRPDLLADAFRVAADSQPEKFEDAIREKLTDCQRKKSRLLDAIAEGVIGFEDAREKVHVLNSEIETYQKELKESATGKTWDIGEIEKIIELDPENFHDFHELRKVISTLFEKILIYSTDIFLYYHFPVMKDGSKVKRLRLQ